MSIAYASEQLEKRFPDTGLAFARRGEALYREQAVEDAVRILTDGVQLYPEYLTGHLVLARIYNETGRLTEAASVLNEALRRDPGCPAALRLSAEVAESLRAFGESAKAYARLAKQEPWDEEFQSRYQRALGLSGQGTSALEAPAPSPGITEFNLNDVADFLPKDGGLESALGAGSQSFGALSSPPMPGTESGPAFGSEEGRRSDSASGSEFEIAEPRPEATVIYTPPETEEPLTETSFPEGMDRVEGSDIEKRLDDIFARTTESTDSGSVTDTTFQAAAETHDMPVADTERVEGADIEKRLDDIFTLSTEASSEPVAASDTAFEAATTETHDIPIADTERVEGADIEKRLDDIFTSNTEPASESVAAADTAFEAATTETHDIPIADTERVQGADIEKRLDDIFAQLPETTDDIPMRTDDAAIVSASATQSSPIADSVGEERLDTSFFPAETIAPTEPQAEEKSAATASTFQPRFAGLDERTVAMPAFTSDSQELAEPTSAPIEEKRDSERESVVETEDLRMIRDTKVYDLTPGETTDTVVGDDISQRLDQLFGLGAPSSTPAAAPTEAEEPGTSETTTFSLEDAEGSTRGKSPSVSGEDVQNRLTEIFGAEDIHAPTEDSESQPMQTQMLPRAEILETASEATPEAPASAPLLSMEEAEDPENAAAPPNVATMTLAEIYFQQGLKEQALQIYRQLLEREPDNETARKRVEEIEALKSGDEAQGSDADRRAPRPGLKVPRRKK